MALILPSAARPSTPSRPGRSAAGCVSSARFHGTTPSISICSEKLSTVRMSTMIAEHERVGQRRRRGDGAHEVGGDEHLEAEQDDQPERVAQRDERGAAVARRAPAADGEHDGDDEPDRPSTPTPINSNDGGDGLEERLAVHGPLPCGKLRLQDSNLDLTAPKAVVLPLHQGGPRSAVQRAAAPAARVVRRIARARSRDSPASPGRARCVVDGTARCAVPNEGDPRRITPEMRMKRASTHGSPSFGTGDTA